MSDGLLASYLNDHLAGSVSGVEIGAHCRDKYADPDLAAFLDSLLTEIEEDRDALKRIMHKVGAGESTVKKSAAWLTEKVARLKTTGTAPHAVAFSRLEQLEALMLGIRGKLALWEVLDDLSRSDSRLKDFDWTTLRQRASDQISRVDERRRAAAREAFTPAWES